ncbi:MAG TPA: magnesium transporter [Phycisphaerae bacterium]|nr:magnesium transporter [Phycisphaerae bacterium]
MQDEIQQLLDRIRGLLESPEDEPLQRALVEGRPEDIAEVFELLDDEERSRIIFALPPRSAAEIIALQDEADLGEVVEDLDDRKLTEIVAELPPDDAADLIGDLPEERVEEVLDRVSDEQAAKIEKLLEYDEESAGGIMTPDLIALTGDTTVGESIRHVRAASLDEHLNEIFVIDGKMRLMGTVPLRRLVTNAKETRLADICDPEPISVRADEDQEEVVRVFRKYDLSVMPVVDAENRLKGRITADDIMDVAEEEAAEDLYRMAGTDLAEAETASSARAAVIRLTWLLPCMLIMMVSATIIAYSQSHLPAGVFGAILAFIPMVAAMSGNSGVQISTVIVRGIATGDLAGTRIGLAFQREGVIALIMAPACGAFAATITALGVPLLRSLGIVAGGVNASAIARAVGLGMTVAILIAGSLGIILPFLFRRLGVDPAIASGPLVTSLNDVISGATYLIIAVAIVT